MNTLWIVETLIEIRSFATKNDMSNLAEFLDTAVVLAAIDNNLLHGSTKTTPNGGAINAYAVSSPIDVSDVSANGKV